MNNKNVVIDINSITNTKSLMDNECKELISMMENYRKMFEDTKLVYDTESGEAYRKLVNRYLDMVENYINKNLQGYINNLDKIKKIYIEEISSISSAIQGGGQ